MPETVELPIQTRRATFRPATADPKARTIALTWTTGATVRRFGFFSGAYDEALSLDPGAVRLGRLNNGANLVDSHRLRGLEHVLGVVEQAEIVGAPGRREGRAVVRFSERAAVEPIWRDVQAGILRNISVGYRAHRVTRIERENQPPLVRLDDWEPLELSLVAVPADSGAQTRADEDEQQLYPCEVTTMTERQLLDAGGTPIQTRTAEPAGMPLALAGSDDPALAERARAAGIRDCGRVLRLPGAVAEGMVAEGIGLDVARSTMFGLANERERAEAIARPHITGGDPGGDDPSFRARQVVDALTHRLSHGEIPLPDSAREVRGRSLAELAAYAGGAEGRRSDRADSWFSSRASWGMHTTSDFPHLLSESGNRVMAEAFVVLASPLRRVARVVTVPDFRTISRLRRGEAAKLLEITEHAEVQSSTVGEEAESYVVKSYARNFILSRNALVNDDLDAFGDFLQDLGRAAATTEAGVLVGLLTANSGQGVTLADGQFLFSTAHANRKTSASGAPSVTTVGAARSAIRLQKSPTNSEPLNLTPRYLLLPAALETTGDQLVAAISPNSTSQVNPFSNLSLLVEPRLDAASLTRWYLIADPAQMAFLEIATLDGSRPMASRGAPLLQTFESEDVLGLKYRAVHDFGAWPVNFRSAFADDGVA